MTRLRTAAPTGPLGWMDNEAGPRPAAPASQKHCEVYPCQNRGPSRRGSPVGWKDRRSGRISRILLPLTRDLPLHLRARGPRREASGHVSKAAIIHLGDLSPGRSSTLPAAQTRRAASRCLFGLAGGGVYPAIAVTRDAVRSYRTFSPLPMARGVGLATRRGRREAPAACQRRYVFCGTVPRLAPGCR
jgi:hypothetical protein